MEYQLSLKGLKEKKIYSLDENFSGISVNGEETFNRPVLYRGRAKAGCKASK